MKKRIKTFGIQQAIKRLKEGEIILLSPHLATKFKLRNKNTEVWMQRSSTYNKYVPKSWLKQGPISYFRKYESDKRFVLGE